MTKDIDTIQIELGKNKSDDNLPIQERQYKMMFPKEGWICPYCTMLEMGEIKIPRNEILAHVTGEHSDEVKPGTTWEEFYKRMTQVGGI